MKKLAIIFVSVLALTNLRAGDSWAKDKSLKICVSSSGQVAARSKCKKGETLFSLSSLTTLGASGPQGPAGEAGPAGEQGPRGLQGPSGVTGFETVAASGNKVTVPGCDPVLNPIGCISGIPGLPGGLTPTVVSVACPSGKVIFAHVCPDKKITVGGLPPTIPGVEVSLLTSTIVNGSNLTCTYNNSTATTVEIPFVPTVVCGPL
jgi:hypothetical protein